jgi:hypothetical protein
LHRIYKGSLLRVYSGSLHPRPSPFGRRRMASP